MRLGFIDFLYAVFCLAVGLGTGTLIAPDWPILFSLLIGVPIAFALYWIFLYPFYRGMKLFPIILPRCPCCNSFQYTHQAIAGPWPRIRFRCTACSDVFVVWLNGRADKRETWDAPVILLKWPYAFGRYQLAKQPKKRASAKTTVVHSSAVKSAS